MSSVIANVVEIEAVHPHPNADRLFLARIKGWQAVIRKREDGSPEFAPGERVIFIPPDSTLPREMAERLGKFLSHATPGNLENIQISYSGRLAAGKTDLVRNAALAGIFSGSEGATANRINAASVADERGIRVQEDKKEFTTGGAGSVLKMVLHSSDGDASGSATVLHGSSPRLLTYDGIDIEAPLTGTLVAIRNHDVPGVIGRVGTILGEHKLNIANFALGRSIRSQRVPQGNALAVVQVDGPISDASLEALRAVDAILQVHLVNLDSEN